MCVCDHRVTLTGLYQADQINDSLSVLEIHYKCPLKGLLVNNVCASEQSNEHQVTYSPEKRQGSLSEHLN